MFIPLKHTYNVKVPVLKYFIKTAPSTSNIPAKGVVVSNTEYSDSDIKKLIINVWFKAIGGVPIIFGSNLNLNCARKCLKFVNRCFLQN